MNTLYLKNYGIWLGGALAISLIINFLYYIPNSNLLFVLLGTIVGSVNTHKALKGNIQFSKAVGPVLMIIGAFFLIDLLLIFIMGNGEYFSYFIEFYIINLFISLMLGLAVILAVGTWYMFEKAGQPGWAFMVPIYNIIVMCRIANKPGWWTAMILLVPIANIVFMIMLFDGIAKSFGKDSGFTVGLIFLRQIFFAILGFGDAQYMLAKPNNTNAELLDN